MKRLAILIVCLGVPATPTFAADGVTFYGRLNIGLERVGASTVLGGGTIRSVRQTNNRSVFGLRGSEDIGARIQALFQIEGTVSPDTGTGSPAVRDTRIGLAGDFGTVFMGNWKTPYNRATSSLDPFYPTTAGYMAIVGNGSAANDDNISDTAAFDRRQRNSIGYDSPSWRGMNVSVAHGAGEERPPGGARPSLTSMSAKYESGRWYAALAHERHHEYQGSSLNDSGTKLGLAYSLGSIRLAGIVEGLRYDTASGPLTSRNFYVSVSHQRGRHGVRLGVAHAANGKGSSTQTVGAIRSGRATGAIHATIGYDYSLSPRSSVYVYHTRLNNDRNSQRDFAINALGAGIGATLTATVIGMRHNF